MTNVSNNMRYSSASAQKQPKNVDLQKSQKPSGFTKLTNIPQLQKNFNQFLNNF